MIKTEIKDYTVDAVIIIRILRNFLGILIF